jgi:hypothetical protein
MAVEVFNRRAARGSPPCFQAAVCGQRLPSLITAGISTVGARPARFKPRRAGLAVRIIAALPDRLRGITRLPAFRDTVESITHDREQRFRSRAEQI